MEISKRLVESAVRHMDVILDRGTYNYRDTKTANAIRLVRKEIAKLKKAIENANTNISGANGQMVSEASKESKDHRGCGQPRHNGMECEIVFADESDMGLCGHDIESVCADEDIGGKETMPGDKGMEKDVCSIPAELLRREG